jgi:flagellar motor protein MotB
VIKHKSALLRSSSWMTTFADLAALLLCFFLMRFALVAPSDVQWAQARDSFMRGFIGSAAATSPETSQIATLSADLSPDRVAAEVAQAGLSGTLNVRQTGAGVLVLIAPSAFDDARSMAMLSSLARQAESADVLVAQDDTAGAQHLIQHLSSKSVPAGVRWQADVSGLGLMLQGRASQ